ncbi:hypothetical protein C8R46DRAFT_1142017 [Mycena filopes]|nr:hypothetical protein C8R46DRAFT_1142017 [Mycena filopes]
MRPIKVSKQPLFLFSIAPPARHTELNFSTTSPRQRLRFAPSLLGCRHHFTPAHARPLAKARPSPPWWVHLAPYLHRPRHRCPSILSFGSPAALLATTRSERDMHTAVFKHPDACRRDPSSTSPPSSCRRLWSPYARSYSLVSILAPSFAPSRPILKGSLELQLAATK